MSDQGYMGRDSWSASLSKLSRVMGSELEQTAQLATHEVFKSVINKSPIDEGTFIANWRVASGTPDSSFDEGKKGEAESIAQAGKALKLPAGGIVYLSNNAPYAVPLEYGYSYKSNSQKAAEGWARVRPDARPAPGGMIRLTLLEWTEHVRKAVRASKKKSGAGTA